MESLDLPHGPWTRVLSGVWSGREVSYYENPDKNLIVMIYDRAGQQVRGVVMILYQFFRVEGNASRLAMDIDANAVLLEKATKTFKGTFLAVSTDPKYVKFTPRALINETTNAFTELANAAAETRRKSEEYKVKLIDVAYSQAEFVHELMGEPLALPSMVVRKPGPGTTSTTPAGEALLGIDLEGKQIKEHVQSFMLTNIIGPQAQAQHAVRLVLEGCVINGVSAVVFNNGQYDNIDKPNSDTTHFSEYGIEVDPIGMPVRKFKPGFDLFINLKLLNKQLFADIAGIGAGRETELIGQHLAESGSLRELQEKLSAATDEETKYFARRAVRVCKLLEQNFPGLFDGELAPREIVAPWLKKMGRIAVVDAKNISETVLKGIMFSVMKTLYNYYKDELSTGDLKVVLVLENADVISGEGTALEREIASLAKLGGNYGLGVCVVAEHELDIDADLKTNASLALKVIDNTQNQVSVKEHSKHIDRVKMRPSLSSMPQLKEPPAPAAEPVPAEPAAPAPVIPEAAPAQPAVEVPKPAKPVVAPKTVPVKAAKPPVPEAPKPPVEALKPPVETPKPQPVEVPKNIVPELPTPAVPAPTVETPKHVKIGGSGEVKLPELASSSPAPTPPTSPTKPAALPTPPAQPTPTAAKDPAPLPASFATPAAKPKGKKKVLGLF